MGNSDKEVESGGEKNFPLFSLRGGEFTCAQREFPHSHVNRCLFLAFSLVIVAAQEEDAPIRHPKSFCG